MTRTPGCLLLKVAKLVFDESVLSAVVIPTIADLQNEVREAGDRRARLRARLRGYVAFWVLVGAAPVAFHRWPTRSIGAEEAAEDRTSGTVFAFYVAAIVLCSWNFLGWWTAVAAVGGTLFAMIIHRWNVHHPAELVLPEKGVWKAPEINQSKIPVDGNIGGLMYVVGSLVIAMIGLPVVRVFFFTSVALGLLCAVALLAWHNAHPRHGNSVLMA